MNGLQHDLREKILVGSPDIRVLSYGEDLKITDWPKVLDKVRRQGGVVTAAPFVLTEALMTAGHDYAGGVYVVGLLPQARGVPDVTTINSYAFVALDKAQDLAGLGDGVTGIEVKTTDRWQAAKIASQLVGALGWPYRTVDWEEQNHSLFQALKLEKLGMGVILLLIVLVAAFNIVSTLTMVVADKTKEIGILKAMGMPAGSIRRIFFAQGLVIGVVGTALGVVLGFGAALALDKYQFIKLDAQVYFIDHLPVSTQPTDVTWIILASIAIAAIATVYPAVQASRLYPIEAIRHE